MPFARKRPPHGNGRVASHRSGKEAPSPRIAAWRALNATTREAPDGADHLNHHIDTPSFTDADRRLATQLMMGLLRRRGALDFYLARLLDKPLSVQRTPILNALRLGVYQMLDMDKGPDYAVVHETVQMIKDSELSGATGLVNAVLRNFIRQRAALEAELETLDEETRFRVDYSCPDWVAETLDAAPDLPPWRPWWGRAAEVPVLHLRVNTLKGTVDEAVEALAREGHAAAPTPIPDVLAAPSVQRPGDLACFQKGLVTVQDAAAALVAHVVAPRPGEKVVDFCSAPGGKTAHLAALASNQATLLATDAARHRMQDMPVTMSRLGVRNVQFEVVNQILIAQHGAWADAVLVDAPCDGMGTIRRHPEIRWLREREDIIQASLRQLTILGLAAQMVRPGGRLVYSTCTLFYEENRRLVDTFLSQRSDFRLVDAGAEGPDWLRPWVAPDGCLSSTLEPDFAMDGFFVAALRRNG